MAQRWGITGWVGEDVVVLGRDCAQKILVEVGGGGTPSDCQVLSQEAFTGSGG